MSAMSFPIENPTNSYWLQDLKKDCEKLPYLASPSTPLEASICIIGSGISGSSIAFHLSKLNPNKKVILLEARDTISAGATGRNGALLWPSLPNRWTELTEKYGLHESKKLMQFAILNCLKIKEFVETIPSNAPHHPLLAPFKDGAIHLIDSERELEEWRLEIEAFKRAGGTLEMDIWTKDQVLEKISIKRPFVGAVHDKLAFRIVPANLVYHLLDRAQKNFKSNFSVMLNTPVSSVNKNNDGFLVHSHALKTPIKCAKIVYCTNAWTEKLLPSFQIVPIKNQVIITEPIADLDKILTMAITANSGYEYMSPREDNRIVLGGFRNLVKPGLEVGNSNDADLNHIVSQALATYLPATFTDLSKVKVHMEWAGIMGFTNDRLPFVGRVGEDEEFVCAGFSGNGMPRCHLSALSVAYLLLGLKPDTTFPKSFAPSSSRSERSPLSSFSSKL